MSTNRLEKVEIFGLNREKLLDCLKGETEFGEGARKECANEGKNELDSSNVWEHHQKIVRVSNLEGRCQWQVKVNFSKDIFVSLRNFLTGENPRIDQAQVVVLENFRLDS